MVKLGELANIRTGAALAGVNPRMLKFLRPGTPNPPDDPGNGEKIAFWIWAWLDSKGIERHDLGGQPGQNYYGEVHDAVVFLYPGLSAKRAWRVAGVAQKVLVGAGSLKLINGRKKGIPPLWWVSHEPPELEQPKTHPRVTERTPIEHKEQPTVTATRTKPAAEIDTLDDIKRPGDPRDGGGAYPAAARAVVDLMRRDGTIEERDGQPGRLWRGRLEDAIATLWPQYRNGNPDTLRNVAAYISKLRKDLHPEVFYDRRAGTWWVPVKEESPASDDSQPVPPPVDYDKAYELIWIWLADQKMERVVRDDVPGDEVQVFLKKVVYDKWPESEGYPPETQKRIYQQVINKLKSNDGAECVRSGSHNTPSTWRFPVQQHGAAEPEPAPVEDTTPEPPTAEVADGVVPVEPSSDDTADVEAPAEQEAEAVPITSAEGVRILFAHLRKHGKGPVIHEGETGLIWEGTLLGAALEIFGELYGSVFANNVARRASGMFKRAGAARMIDRPNPNRRTGTWLLLVDEWPGDDAPGLVFEAAELEQAAPAEDDVPTEQERVEPAPEARDVQPEPPAEDEPPQKPAQGEASPAGQDRRPDDQHTESAVARQLGGLLGTNSDMDWLSSALTSVLAHDAQVGHGSPHTTEAVLQDARIEAVTRDLARAKKVIGFLMQAAQAGLGIGESDD